MIKITKKIWPLVKFLGKDHETLRLNVDTAWYGFHGSGREMGFPTVHVTPEALKINICAE
jgi:hypothetical protein